MPDARHADRLHRRPLPRAAAVLCLLAAAAVLSACTTAGYEVQSAYDKLDGLPATAQSAVSADFDGDGDTDVLLGYDGAAYGGLTLLRDDGYGWWQRSAVDVSGVSAKTMTVTDLNGDGRPDVVAGGDGPYLRLLTNDGAGGFTVGSYNLVFVERVARLVSGTAPDGTRLIAAVYAVPSAGGTAWRVILFAAQNGTLTIPDPVGSFAPPAVPTAIHLDDVDGDGRMDLLVGTANGQVLLYRGTGAQGVLSETPTVLPDAGRGTAVLALAAGDVATPPSHELGPTGDWDTDGRHDVLAAFDGGEWVYGWRATGSGTFGSPLHLGGLGSDSSTPIRLVMIDPAGSGEWAATTGTWLYFGDKSLISRAWAPGRPNSTCGARNDLALIPRPDAPYPGLVYVCADPADTVVIGVAWRTRLGLPAPVGFDPQPVGAAPQTRTVRITVPDIASASTAGRITVNDVRVEGRDAADFQVDHTKGACLGIPPFTSGNPCVITVTFDPASRGGKEARLVIDTDAYRADGMPVPSVPLTGTATGPVLTAPDRLDLGAVPVGQARTGTVRVENAGEDPLTVSAAAIEGQPAGWTVERNGCADPVPAGEACEITVQVRPPAAGASGATLRLDSNAPDRPVTRVALAADGVAAPEPPAPGGPAPGDPDRPAAPRDRGTGSGDDRVPPARARLALSAPRRLLMTGRRTRTLRLVVRNAGRVAAADAVLRVRLPRAVQRLAGRRRQSGTVRVRIGRIPAGGRRTVTLRLRMTRGRTARLAVHLTARQAPAARATVVLRRR